MENVKRLPLAFNNDGETHLDVSFGYDKGGLNWLNGQQIKRGYYLYCCPIHVEKHDFGESIREYLGKGTKLLLKEVSRQGKKAEQEAWNMVPAKMPDLIQTVLNKYGLKLRKERKTIALYQINSKRNKNRVRFMGLDELKEFGFDFDPSIYDKVWEGEAEIDSLDEIFTMFNRDNRPGAHRFCSMSVSDVVEVKEPEGSKFYFCDSIGFEEVAFDPAKATDASPRRIDVLYVEPGKEARMVSVEGTYEEFLRLCEAELIQAVYPFDNPDTVLVCNEEALYDKRAVRNRALRDENGKIYDVVAGPFFICHQNDEGKWVSLDASEREQCMKMYRKPKRYEFWADGPEEFDLD